MGVWEYGSDDFVNILSHINSLAINTLLYLVALLLFLGKKKSSPHCWDRFHNFITEHKFIQLFYLF